MKKILQFITGGLIKDIGQIIDDLVTTDEKRLYVVKQRGLYKPQPNTNTNTNTNTNKNGTIY